MNEIGLTDLKNEKLIPCPFCKQQNAFVSNAFQYNRHIFWVHCNVCSATGPIKESYTDALNGWNESKGESVTPRLKPGACKSPD